MKDKFSVCLLNDSFLPAIDGVANAVFNYASVLSSEEVDVVVSTPKYPGVEDNYPFEVVRYPSLNTTNLVGYRTGYPFSIPAIRKIAEHNVDVIHCHCPIVSLLMARYLRKVVKAPIIFTYHTKFDIEVRKAIETNTLQSAAIKAIVKNIEAADEVWVVSEGAGENLRSMGYSGEYVVMDNGVDFPLGRVSDEEIAKITQLHNLEDNIPVFLFVGRLTWYKGTKITLDALKKIKDRGERFKMIFVGDDNERPEIEAYTKSIGLEDDCIFAGAVRDRQLLRAYFCRSNLFLFPSTYDTNGIVVREAAACALPSILIKGSCAAEGVEDGVSGLLIEENPDSMAEMLVYACHNLEKLKEIGRGAQNKIYVSWENAIKNAYERYKVVYDRCRGKDYDTPELREDEMFNLVAEWYKVSTKMKNKTEELKEAIKKNFDI